MKFLVVALLVAICAAAEIKADTCKTEVKKGCGDSTFGTDICIAQYGDKFEKIQPEVQSYINAQLIKSYDYLLLATYFNSYKKNRPGFQKLYQGLSDRSFDDTIDMIKQLTRRGGIVDFTARHEGFNAIETFEVDEIESLAVALDSEKLLAKGAVHVHTKAIQHQDPEMAHYIEEKFLGKQAETVRKLSGYANDLVKMMNQTDTSILYSSLALHLFDEYLHKQ